MSFMWLTYFNWFMAFFSIILWIGTYIMWDRGTFYRWFDNKFGKDDPMPPTPQQKKSDLKIDKQTEV